MVVFSFPLLLSQRFAGTRFEEQRQLHMPQKHKATEQDSTLQVEMNNRRHGAGCSASVRREPLKPRHWRHSACRHRRPPWRGLFHHRSQGAHAGSRQNRACAGAVHTSVDAALSHQHLRQFLASLCVLCVCSFPLLLSRPLSLSLSFSLSLRNCSGVRTLLFFD